MWSIVRKKNESLYKWSKPHDVPVTVGAIGVLSGHWFPPHYRCPDWQIHAGCIVYQTLVLFMVSNLTGSCYIISKLYCCPHFDIVSVIPCFVLLPAVAGHSLADCRHRAERFIGDFRQ